MNPVTLICPLIHREIRSLLVHRMLTAGLVVALLMGLTLALAIKSPETRLWTAYQGIYYVVPLFATLATIMIVRQDLRESPLLALLPGSSFARVFSKALVAIGYLVLLLVLLLGPSLLSPGSDVGSLLRLGVGSGLVACVFVALGLWRGFRARHEVRAYLGGLAWWFVLLFGSGAVAYGAHVWLASDYTPAVTLFALMANPLESFRLFVFFQVGEIPMNPQTDNSLAVWWIGNPLLWLAIVTIPFLMLPLVHAGWNLRLRAHGEQ